MAAPQKTDSERLADAEEIVRKKNAEIVGLKRDLNRLQREEDTAERIREEILQLTTRPPEPPEWVEGPGGKSGSRGCPMTMWSDFHYGEVVDPDQVNRVNKFNPGIAKARIQRLVDTTVDLCFNHMGRAAHTYPGIVVCLGGDMVGGDIHEELMATNARTTHQAVNDLTDLLASAIENMATKFGKVFLPAVVGNHGRSTRRMYMKNRVFTNYDWSIYTNLERHFRKEKHIVVSPSNTADALFSVFGHRFLLTHGDSLGVKGGDGIIGALGPIMRGALKVHTSNAEIGRDFDTLVMGHWHQYIALPGLIVNNALKGYDEFAYLALRARPSRPSQALWFCHPEHGITAHWQVYLEGLKRAERSDKWITWPE